MSNLRTAYVAAHERLSALESITSFSRTALLTNTESYFAAQRELERLVQLAVRNRRYASLETMLAKDEKLDALIRLEFEDDGLDHTLSELLVECAWRCVEEAREALNKSRGQYEQLEHKTRGVRDEVRQLHIACLNWAQMREGDARWEGKYI